MTTCDRARGECDGFTLVEAIVVIAVVLAIAGTAMPLVSALADRERETEVRTELGRIGDALESHFADHGRFPATLTESTFVGVYLAPGVGSTTTIDPFAGATYRYAIAMNPDVATVWSVDRNHVDDGVANESLKVVVTGAVPGYRTTRARMRIVVEALAAFVEGGGVLTGDWTTDRAAMGLGTAYHRDGFGTPFTLDPTTLTLRSAGADRIAGNADDRTP
jgi:type II secretory pathway pseudopilin PulG